MTNTNSETTIFATQRCDICGFTYTLSHLEGPLDQPILICGDSQAGPWWGRVSTNILSPTQRHAAPHLASSPHSHHGMTAAGSQILDGKCLFLGACSTTSVVTNFKLLLNQDKTPGTWRLCGMTTTPKLING